MLKETTLYTAICDRCEKDLSKTHFADKYFSEKELETNLAFWDWIEDADRHFCPSCYTINENDEIKLKPMNYEADSNN